MTADEFLLKIEQLAEERVKLLADEIVGDPEIMKQDFRAGAMKAWFILKELRELSSNKESGE